MVKEKKQKEESDNDDDDVDDDESEVVVDSDSKDWDQIEPPGEVDSGDEEEDKDKEEETLGMDVDEKDEAVATTAPADNKVCFSASALHFTQAELPLLGYGLASFVFFLSAVTRRTKTAQFVQDFNSNSVNDMYSDVMDNAFEDIWNYIEPTYTDLTSSYTNICAGYGGTLRSSHFAYALSLGLIGALMAGAAFGWMRYNNGLATKRNGEQPVGGDVEGGSQAGSEDARITTEEDPNKSKSELFLDNYKWVINLVLFLWAFIGWAFFTFGGGDVFAYTGNGFFALWAMMIFAIWNFGITVDDITEQAKNSDSIIYGMILGSVIAIIELTTGPVPYQWQSNKGIASYALAVAVISIVFGLVTMGMSRFAKDELNPKIRFWCLLVILVLWIAAACLTTFIGPFLTTGNGYFAVWGSVVFAVMAFVDTQKELQNRSDV